MAPTAAKYPILQEVLVLQPDIEQSPNMIQRIKSLEASGCALSYVLDASYCEAVTGVASSSAASQGKCEILIINLTP